MKLVKGAALLSSAILLAACGSDNDSDSESAPVVDAPATYKFPSMVNESADSSVSYSGQATRQLLINDLKALIGTDNLYDQQGVDKSAVLERLNRIYEFGTIPRPTDLDESEEWVNLLSKNVFDGDIEVTPVAISIKDEDAPLVVDSNLDDYNELSGGKNLKSKMAGQDNDLTNEFIGWTVAISDEQTDNDRPHLLIQSWFNAIADLAVDGDATTTYVSAEGLDYQQLVQKFLLGAVAYSQAAEDYLKADKGLNKQNTEGDKEGAKDYTSLEHQWDEGFGYFGASRDYNLRTDAETKSTYYNDTDSDGVIDLYSEYSFGHSINAVKRDAGAKGEDVDFSKNAMDAFLNGRQLIQDFYGTDPSGASYHKYLVQYAETALNNWENAVVATVIHYINDYTADINSLTNDEVDASFANIAKHWSEMKGFALGLQFSPVAQISMTDLKKVHDLMGEQPVTQAGDEATAYLAKLAEAREILQNAYGFSDVNVAGW